MCDNLLKDDELPKLVDLYNEDLAVLKIAGNKIESLEKLKCLNGLKHLLKLDLTMNKVCKEADYRSQVFAMLTSLEVLDGED